MAPTCEQYLIDWIAEIEAIAPNPIRAAQAARNLVSCLGDSSPVQQLMQALANGREDRISCETCQMLLPSYIQEQVEADQMTGQASNNQDIRDHLAQCPYCAAAYAQVAEWLLASQADAIAVAASYPVLDTLPITPAPTPTSVTSLPSPPHWSAETAQKALAEGKQWIHDAASGLYLLLGRALQTQPAGSWALKSSAQGMLLAQIVLGEDEVEGWEIEASVFADEEKSAFCRIEVALYRIDDSDIPLRDIAVTLRAGAKLQTGMTDEGGVAEFLDIPRLELAQATIRVTLPT